VAFDASFRGASGGKPRFVEDPTYRVDDICKVARPWDEIAPWWRCSGAGGRLPDVLALIPNVLRRSFCRALRRFGVADRRQTEQPAIFSRELLDAFIADRECGGAR
jgi:hypothetical protein